MRKIFILPALAILLSGCSNNSNNFYYIYGTFSGTNKKIKFNKRSNKQYECLNLILKRGDTFKIEGPTKISYDSFDNESKKSILNEDLNSFYALNEGIYNVNILIYNNIEVYFNKVSSSYKEAKLYSLKYSEGIKLNYNESDFTYYLNDVFIPFNDQFYIKLDEDKLDYDDLYLDDNTSKYFNEIEGNIKNLTKGTFDLKVDFLNKKPLKLELKNEIKVNSLDINEDEMINIIDNLSTNYLANSIGSIIKQKNINDGIITNTNIKIDRFENEVTEVVGDLTNNKKDIYDTYLTSKQLNKIYVSEKDSTKSYANAQKIITDDSKEEGISISKAKDIINNVNDNTNLFLSSTIKEIYKGSYVNQNKDSLTDFKNRLTYEIKYLNNYSDALDITLTNFEYYTSSSLNKAFSYKLNLKLDENLNLLSSEMNKIEYNIEDVIFDESKNSYTIKEGASELSNILTNIDIKEGVKTTNDENNFLLKEDIYFANKIDGFDLLLDAGDTFSISDINLSLSPTTSLDKNNFYIKNYDEKYIRQLNNVYEAFNPNKEGTILTIGNSYNNVECKIKVIIDYPVAKSITIKDEKYVDNYYSGKTYNFNINLEPSKTKQGVKVDVLDTDYISLTKLENNETGSLLSLKFLKEGVGRIKITSLNDSNLSIIKTFEIKENADFINIAGSYFDTSYSPNWVSKIIINNDGSVTLINDKNLDITFNVILNNNVLSLSGENTYVKKFQAEVGFDHLNNKAIKNVSINFNKSEYESIEYTNYAQDIYLNGEFISSENEKIIFSKTAINPYNGKFEITYEGHNISGTYRLTSDTYLDMYNYGNGTVKDNGTLTPKINKIKINKVDEKNNLFVISLYSNYTNLEKTIGFSKVF